MSIKYCPCGHVNPPIKGVIAKRCEKCGHSFATIVIPPSSFAPKAPVRSSSQPFNQNDFMSERQRKIMEKRAAAREESGDDDYEEVEDDGFEGDFDPDALKIKVDFVPENNKITLGGLVNQKKNARDDQYARSKGGATKADVQRALRKTAESSRDNPADIN